MTVSQWFGVDLHTHTPFDQTRNWGRSAAKAREKGLETETQQCTQWLDRCVDAGVQLVAVTDHNQIAGYERLSAVYETWKERASGNLRILPGVEISISGCHFLVIADPSEEAWLRQLIAASFGNRPPLRTPEVPEEAEISLTELCRLVQEHAEAGHQVLALPAHVDRNKGLVQELSGLLRERAFAQRAWSGFQLRGTDFHQSKRLLRIWASASLFGRLPDELSQRQEAILDRYVSRDAWPLVDASDPEDLDSLGSTFTWMKMERPSVEGIRQALLDPESRVRRHDSRPPDEPGTWIHSVEFSGLDIEGGSVFENDADIQFSPALNAIIGGRGSGKSTLLELLRWGLERDRREDFAPDEEDIREEVRARLSTSGEEREGGILTDETVVRITLYRDGRPIVVERTLGGITAGPMAGDGELDIRTVLQPRILSQRQIAGVARDPRAIRREVDHAIDRDQFREWEGVRKDLVSTISDLQSERRERIEELGSRPKVRTRIDLLEEKIQKLEAAAEAKILDQHKALEVQEVWLSDVAESLEQAAERLPSGLLSDEWLSEVPDGPATDVLGDLRNKLVEAEKKIEASLEAATESLTTARRLVEDVQKGEFETIREPISTAYEELVEELKDEQVEIGQLTELRKKCSALKKQLEGLNAIPDQISRLDDVISRRLDELHAHHESQRDLREMIADRLEQKDADIRLVVSAHSDLREIIDQKDRWWAGTGMRTGDWELLVGMLTEVGDSTPLEEWERLVSAVREDHERLRDEETAAAEAIRSLAPEADKLTGYLESAVRDIDLSTVDEMQRFVPDDEVKALFRDRDGEFRSIRRASLGQRNTAILSLLLTVGDDPLLLDQPEDDLDNRYIYDVVVQLLRSTKTERQIIAVTHSANVPVNGDAECIIALDPGNGMPWVAGTLDREEIKEAVNNVMEGSEAAFRLRRQRYGY